VGSEEVAAALAVFASCVTVDGVAIGSERGTEATSLGDDGVGAHEARGARVLVDAVKEIGVRSEERRLAGSQCGVEDGQGGELGRVLKDWRNWEAERELFHGASSTTTSSSMAALRTWSSMMFWF
jgi:hypothetical protein